MGVGSSFKLRKAGSPFPLPPRPKVRPSFPFWGGLLRGPETEGAGRGRLSCAPPPPTGGGCSERPSLPCGYRACSRGSLGPAGDAPAGGGSLGIPFGARCGSSSDRRSALLARQGSARGAPAVCVRRGRHRARGRGPGPPTRPSPTPPPAQRPLLGLAASLRSARRSAGSSFGSSSVSRSGSGSGSGSGSDSGSGSGSRSRSRSCSGSRSDASALWLGLELGLGLGLGLELGRRGGRAAPPLLARRAGAGRVGRGRAERTCCPRSPAEAAAAASQPQSQPCPAAAPPACPSALRRRPSHSRPLPGLLGGAPPWPQQRCVAASGLQQLWAAARVIPVMGGRGRGKGRAAPLCAQPPRHPRSCRRDGRGRETSLSDGQACVENDIQTGGSREGQTHRHVQRRVDNGMCREGRPNSLVRGETGHLVVVVGDPVTASGRGSLDWKGLCSLLTADEF